MPRLWDEWQVRDLSLVVPHPGHLANPGDTLALPRVMRGLYSGLTPTSRRTRGNNIKDSQILNKNSEPSGSTVLTDGRSSPFMDRPSILDDFLEAGTGVKELLPDRGDGAVSPPGGLTRAVTQRGITGAVVSGDKTPATRTSRPGPICSKQEQKGTKGTDGVAGASGRATGMVVRSDVLLPPSSRMQVRAPARTMSGPTDGTRTGISKDTSRGRKRAREVTGTSGGSSGRETPTLVSKRKGTGGLPNMGVKVSAKKKKEAEIERKKEEENRRLEQDIRILLDTGMLRSLEDKRPVEEVFRDNATINLLREAGVAELASEVGRALGAVRLVSRRSRTLKGTFVGLLNCAVATSEAVMATLLARKAERDGRGEEASETRREAEELRVELRKLRVENRRKEVEVGVLVDIPIPVYDDNAPEQPPLPIWRTEKAEEELDAVMAVSAHVCSHGEELRRMRVELDFLMGAGKVDRGGGNTGKDRHHHHGSGERGPGRGKPGLADSSRAEGNEGQDQKGKKEKAEEKEEREGQEDKRGRREKGPGGRTGNAGERAAGGDPAASRTPAGASGKGRAEMVSGGEEEGEAGGKEGDLHLHCRPPHHPPLKKKEYGRGTAALGRPKPPRSAAVTVMCPDGKYENFMLEARRRIRPADLEINGSLRVRRALNGAMLIEVPGLNVGASADRLAEELRKLAADKGPGYRVQRPAKLAALRIAGLYATTGAEEVAAAVALAEGCLPEEISSGEMSVSQRGIGAMGSRNSTPPREEAGTIYSPPREKEVGTGPTPLTQEEGAARKDSSILNLIDFDWEPEEPLPRRKRRGEEENGTVGSPSYPREEETTEVGTPQVSVETPASEATEAVASSSETGTALPPGASQEEVDVGSPEEA
ncbi:hypothetical protein EAI_07839 [Harpegnathos saltator]|uniref:Gag-like protein n=1 Tax=Harpegnathos saltator TaxID=610380 RepID=E2B4N2_HARSA|nr:hypothetical protein EAI_07839 [Harpegnathos saltator]